MKPTADEKPLVSHSLITARDIKIALCALFIVFVAGSFYVKSQELAWKRKWMELASQKFQAIQKYVPLEIRRSHEGTGFETLEVQPFLESVSTCATNAVNNVFYAGTDNDYDYFVHNSDCWTHRVRVRTQHLNGESRIPLTEDVSRWIPVATIPTRAASDLAVFLNNENTGE